MAATETVHCVTMPEITQIIRDELLPAMKKLREDGDAAEMLTSKKYWPLPNYGLLMFGEK